MKICILTQYYYPEMGAPQARLYELSDFLKKNNHNVEILTAIPNYPLGRIFKNYNKFYKKEKINEIIVYRSYIFPSNSMNLILRIWNYFSFVISSFITGLIQIRKIDIIFVESPPLFLGLSAYLLSKIKRAKLIFNVSDLWPESALILGVVKKGYLYTLALKLEQFFYQKSWLITGQSHGIINNIHTRYPNLDLFRLSNGVDIDFYSPDKKNNILNKWISNKKFSCVYAGLHGFAQGLEQIVELAKKAELSHDNVQFILIGDGNEKNKIIKLASNYKLKNITFVESQSKDLMPKIWASADIGIVTLKGYIPGAVPSKLYEIMSSGTPVLMIGDGEPSEIVLKSKCGLSVKPYDYPRIVDAFKILVENPSLRKEYANNGRKEVEKKFNRKEILKEFNNYMVQKYENN